MVCLRRMTSSEFDAFAEYSARDYANDLMHNQGLDAASAAAQARREFLDMLPDGVDTDSNALMVVEADGRSVGAIWYLYEVTDGVRHAFLNDFIIAPDERRKGYASAALAEMEAEASAHSCAEVRLYVWNGNLPGLNLYAGCGYSTFRRTDDGIYMNKKLNGGMIND